MHGKLNLFHGKLNLFHGKLNLFHGKLNLLHGRGGIYDSTKSKTRWARLKEPVGTKHISILASTEEEFARKEASPYHLYLQDPDAEKLEYKGDRAGSTEPRNLREDELELIQEAEKNPKDMPEE